MQTKKPIKRNKFTSEEDRILERYVAKYGDHNWQYTCNFLPNRTIRQCRERWKYFLSPNTIGNKKKWTTSEDELLLNKYEKYGPKWAKINSFFQGRTDVSIKNRFHLLMRNNAINLNKFQHIENQNDNDISQFEITPDDKKTIKNDIRKFSSHDTNNKILKNDKENIDEDFSIQFLRQKSSLELPCPISLLYAGNESMVT